MPNSIHLAAVAGVAFAAGAGAVLIGGDLVAFGPEPQAPAAATPAQPFTYADAVARAAPAVVSIYGSRGAGAADSADARRPRVPGSAPPPSPGVSLGSGVLVSEDGLIVTNGHIIDGAASVFAELPGGRVLDVERLGVDPETDLAVLRAAEQGLPAVPVAAAADLRVGDVVLAIGNPFGLSQTVSLGIVSAVGRSHLGLTGIEDFIQTDAAINPGNSGGALIDAHGRLVGINTAIMSESGLSEGVGFAIPADLVLRVVGAIAQSGVVDRGWIGIAASTMTPQLASRFGLRAPHGVLVTRVSDDSPAARAGLRAGDVVSRAAGRELHRAHDLREAITAAGSGRPVTLHIWRGSERLRSRLVTEERPLGGVLEDAEASVAGHRTGLRVLPTRD